MTVVLATWFSDLDDTELDFGLMNVNVNAVPLHSIIAPVLDDLMAHSHALLRGHLAVREVAHQGVVLGL